MGTSSTHSDSCTSAIGAAGCLERVTVTAAVHRCLAEPHHTDTDSTGQKITLCQRLVRAHQCFARTNTRMHRSLPAGPLSKSYRVLPGTATHVMCKSQPFLKSYGSTVCCACSSRSSWAYTAGGTNAFQHNPTWCRQVDTWTCLMHSEYVWCAELNSYDVSHFLHACLACGYCFKKIWFMVVEVGYLSPILAGDLFWWGVSQLLDALL